MATIPQPAFTPVPFASGAGTSYITNPVPEASQIGTTSGAASYTDGFPPLTFEPIASGGIPPNGSDMNGVLYALSEMARWKQAGGSFPFDATFAAAIGGYPVGATVDRSDHSGKWLNTVAGNTTDPDSTSSSGWVEVRANNGVSTISVTSGSVTPTANVLGAQVLVVTGTLTAAAKLVLPLRAGAQWIVKNNTTGSYALTVGGATGSTVTVTQGSAYHVFTDGTNYYGATSDVSGLYLPLHGTADAATKLANPRAIALGGGGPVTATGVNFDGSANITLTTAIADNALTTSMISGLSTYVNGLINTALANYLPKNNPTFTGTLTGPAYNKVP